MLSKFHLFNTLEHIGRLGVMRIGQRKRACIDILLIISLVFVDLWFLKPFGFKLTSALVYLGLVVLMACIFLRIRKLPYLSQLPRQTLPRISAVVAIATVIQVALILICAYMAGVLEAELTWASFGKPPSRLPSWAVEKVITVTVQQVGLQLVFFPLCFEILNSKWASALIGSGLFALLHAPNPLLMIGTFIAGPVWFWLFLYGGRLIPIVLSHIILASFLRFAIVSHVHLGLGVGARALPKLCVVWWLDNYNLWPAISRYSSKEYFNNQGGTNERFIHGCYRDILGRNESEAEKKRIFTEMQYRTRKELVIGFFTHPEYIRKKNLSFPGSQCSWYMKPKYKVRKLKRPDKSR
ncbi:MAG: type II CAAX endopeptidase family protein [Thermodesulfobacteriota bacterium]|nr:type II CAAX endopeptidase family protein [Thermodesulfobacteriota bacterium]